MFVCMCVQMLVVCIHYSRLCCCVLMCKRVHLQVSQHMALNSRLYLSVTHQTGSELQLKQISANKLVIVGLIRQDTLP